jgi:hypothetical protein
LTANHPARINDEAVSSALLAFLVVLMFDGHTSSNGSAAAKRIQVGVVEMDFVIAVGVLFLIGYGAGFSVRALSTPKRSWHARYRPMSSLRGDFDYREDPVWNR